jgi:hypothetical protein
MKNRRQAMKQIGATAVIGLVALTTLLIYEHGQAAAALASACRPTVTSAAIRYCGSATATLSIFKGITFRSGSCVVRPGGSPSLSLKLGQRSLKNPFQTGGTNSGLPYFDLSVDGPLSSPVGGGVAVFWRGRHWYGRGVSFKGNARAGMFVVQGIPQRGSHGTATGSYRC